MKKSTLIVIIAAAAALVAMIVTAVCVAVHLKNNSGDEIVLKHIDPVGEVPEQFKRIIEEDLFYGLDIKKEGLYKIYYPTDNTVQIVKYDKYGGELMRTESDKRHSWGSPYNFTVLSDGGIIYADAFIEYHKQEGGWASEDGVVSYLKKFDASGKLVWELEFNDGYNSEFDSIVEYGGNYYIFGSQNRNRTQSLNDGDLEYISALKISSDGKILKEAKMSGCAFAFFYYAGIKDGAFELCVMIQKEEKDYPEDRILTVDADLNLISEVKKEFPYEKTPCGWLDGKECYDTDKRFDSFDAGFVESVIDYGDTYLVVSLNPYELIENNYASSIRYYAESVYSMYDKNGNLLWRAAAEGDDFIYMM